MYFGYWDIWLLKLCCYFYSCVYYGNNYLFVVFVFLIKIEVCYLNVYLSI